MSSNVQHENSGFSLLDFELSRDISKMTWNVDKFECIFDEVVFWNDTATGYNLELAFDMVLITAHVYQYSYIYKRKHLPMDRDKKKERLERSEFYSYLKGLLPT